MPSSSASCPIATSPLSSNATASRLASSVHALEGLTHPARSGLGFASFFCLALSFGLLDLVLDTISSHLRADSVSTKGGQVHRSRASKRTLEEVRGLRDDLAAPAVGRRRPRRRAADIEAAV